MMSPAVVVKRVLPDVDERSWMVVAAIGVFAVLAMKEITLPTAVIMLATLVGLTALFMVGRQSPELPFYVLIAYVPFSHILSGHRVQADRLVTPTLLLMGAIVAAQWWSQRAQEGRWSGQVTHAGKALLAFLLLAVLSFLRAGRVYGAWYLADRVAMLVHWLVPIAGFFLTLWVVRDARVLKTVLALIMVAVVVVALMALREYLTRAGDSFDQSRVRGIADHPNVLAAFFVSYMFVFLGGFLVQPRRWVGGVLVLPFLLCVRGVMVTFSRGAYLALGVGALTACWVRHKGLFITAVALGALLLLHPTWLPPGIRYRMGMTFVQGGGEFSTQGTVTEHLETSAGARVTIWHAAVHMIQDHPWWGVGFGAFNGLLAQYTQGKLSDLNAHNSFLMIAAEQGLLAAGVFIGALGLMGASAWWLSRHTQDQALKAMAIGFLGGLAGFMVANLFTVCIDAPEVVSYFWILGGLVVRAVWLERTRQAT